MAEALPPAPRTRQVVLGLFICWQLWFLFAQNIFGWIQDLQPEVRRGVSERPKVLAETIEQLAPGFTQDEGRGQVFELAKWVYDTNKPWAQITGQHQQWALFSGNYSRDCVFPALLLRWTDELPEDMPWISRDELDWRQLLEKHDDEVQPRLVLSEQDPGEYTHYFRWRRMRLRRFENGLHLALRPTEGDTDSERAQAWDESIKGHLRSKGYLLTTYLKVRFHELKCQLGDLPPPKQVILVLRRVHTVDPLDAPPHWTGPFTTPILLWEPPRDGEGPGQWQRFDPMRGGFRSWE